jgi:hypothetical protein
MSKAPSAGTYARIVGEVAIAWNLLEQRLDVLASHYLPLDPTVSSYILRILGNATKADFISFLAEHYEPNPLLREHALHAVALANRLRENRNILEHAAPFIYSNKYNGTVWKSDKRGRLIPFAAPIDQLKSLLNTMETAVPYVRWIAFCVCMNAGKPFEGIAGGPQTPAAALRVLASIERPQLPNKIAPHPDIQDIG